MLAENSLTIEGIPLLLKEIPYCLSIERMRQVAWGKELQTEHEKWLTDKLPETQLSRVVFSGRIDPI